MLINDTNTREAHTHTRPQTHTPGAGLNEICVYYATKYKAYRRYKITMVQEGKCIQFRLFIWCLISFLYFQFCCCRCLGFQLDFAALLLWVLFLFHPQFGSCVSLFHVFSVSLSLNLSKCTYFRCAVCVSFFGFIFCVVHFLAGQSMSDTRNCFISY